MNKKKVCFITCVNDEEMYQESILYINSLNVPNGYKLESIRVKQASCITEAYNKAIKSTDAKYKVYLHQDVFIINKNFIYDILAIFTENKHIGMIGVVGAKNIPINAIWWESKDKYGKVFDSHTGAMELINFNEVENNYEEVGYVDGLIMVTQYDISWREDIFTGWHFYDLSQSVEFIKAGYSIVVPKQDMPWCIHDSGIANIKNGFEYYRNVFLHEYKNYLNYSYKKDCINIAFLEANNIYDLSAQTSMAYQQIKSYVLAYSKYKSKINMFFCASHNDLPENIDIIGISSTSQNVNECIKLGQSIRGRYQDALLILGGHHISHFPSYLPKEFNVGVLFEGEETFLEIVDRYVDSCKQKHIFDDIKGIVFYDATGQFVQNPINNLITPLDRIPFPSFEDNQPYIFSSRGCPYDCSFCASAEYWKKYRTFSAEYVVAEVEHIIKNYPHIKNILFWDDLVIADKNRFREIVKEIESKGINKRVSFSFAVRANLVDEEICGLLKRINIAYVSFGAESGSDRILRMLKGKSVSVEINQRALDLLSKYQIFTTCGFIIGCPTETIEEVRKTFDFILKNYLDGKMNDCAINVLMPLPGTFMWKYAIEKKIITEPIQWERLQVFASYKNSKVKDIGEWVNQRLKTKSYYLNEEYVPEKQLLEMLCEFETNLNKISHLINENKRFSSLSIG